MLETRTKRRWWPRVLFVIVGAYLGVLGVLLAFERKLIFRPATAAQYWQDPPDSRIQELLLTSSAGDKIHGWYLKKQGATGAIHYSHGNAGNLSGRGRSMVALADRLNCSIIIYDYPGYGMSSGKPSEAGCYAAADASWSYLTQRENWSPEQITLIGASLGGAMAIDLAARQPHRALVVAKTFTSIPDMAQSQYPWLPARYLVQTKFDNLSKIGKCQRPLFLVHGRNDQLVPYSQSVKLFDAHAGPKERFDDDSNHHDPLPSGMFPSLLRFLSEHP